MQYALITLAESQMCKWELDINENWQYAEFTAPAGTIADLISYDGISAYTPPDGLSLAQVPDDARMGDSGY